MRPNLFDTRAGIPSARIVAAATLLLVAVCALAAAVRPAPAGATIAEQQAALNAVRDQQTAISQRLDESNREINALIGKVSDARQAEEAAATALQAKQEELAAAEDQLAKGRRHLERVRKHLHAAVHELSRILVGVYKSDDPDMIKLLIESSTWEDASVDATYLDHLHQYQVDVVNRVKDLRNEVQATVSRLADTKDRIAAARDDLAARHQELADQRAALESQEQQLYAAKAARRQTLQRLTAREGDLEGSIAAAQRRQAQAAAAAAAEPDPQVAAPAPTAPPPAPNGDTATLNPDGSASAPANAPQQVKDVIAAANAIRDKPYVWGGGHGSFEASGYDCSGAVSYALHGGGFLSSPLDSTGFMSWGEPGTGNWITVYANSGHAYAVIAGLRWDTSDSGGDGPSWADYSSSWEQSQGFTAVHPAGY
jgi:cell wall-associated NlpC family hydrolase